MPAEAAGAPTARGPKPSPSHIAAKALPFLLLYAILAGPAFLTDRSGLWLCASTFLALVLALLSAIDALTFRLPDVLTLPLIVAGLAYAFVADAGSAGWHALAAIAGYGAVAFVAHTYRKWRGFDGLGLGDAKLFAAAGAWLGLEHLPFVMLAASLTALLAVLLEAARSRRLDPRMRLAFGPYLALGLWLGWSMHG